jgi:hypothetical protein
MKTILLITLTLSSIPFLSSRAGKPADDAKKQP